MHFDTFTENGARSKNTVIAVKRTVIVILDLRGNGGGIMEEAVKIVNIFVPRDKRLFLQEELNNGIVLLALLGNP